jgi:hypothetical protein
MKVKELIKEGIYYFGCIILLIGCVIVCPIANTYLKIKDKREKVKALKEEKRLHPGVIWEV